MATSRSALRARSAIVGAADIASPTGALDRTARALEVDTTRAALADAGLGLADVDAEFCTGGLMPSMELAEYPRMQSQYTDSTMTGGSSFEVHVEHAAAIALELCEVALIVDAATPRSRGVDAGDFARASSAGHAPVLEWDVPFADQR